MKSVKKKYMKPSIKVAEWDFNEAVCQTQTMCTSVSRCISITTAGTFDGIQTRGDYTGGSTTGEWNRVGSR